MLVEITKIGCKERPCVTSLDVAQTFGKSHQHVLRDVRSLECSDEFRLSNFGQSSYVNAQGKNQPMVVMTRDGFTLLVMGYNGKLAMKFKEAYIKQFNAMESVLRKKLIARERGRASREFLTDSIQQSDEDERMHGHAYSTYTNCIYKVLFGKSAAQLRMDYGIGRTDNLRDCFSPEDLAALDSMEHLVSGLVACGWEYGRIKDFIEQTNTQKFLMA